MRKKKIIDFLKDLGVKEVTIENDDEPHFDLRGEDETGTFMEQMTNSDFIKEGL